MVAIAHQEAAFAGLASGASGLVRRSVRQPSGRLGRVWAPDSRLHIRYSTRARQSRQGVRSCHPYRRDPPVVGAVDAMDVAVASAANCLGAEGLVVVLDSMLHKRMIDMADAKSIVAASRFAHLNLAQRCDPRSESGTETMIRLRLRAEGIQLRTQVVIPESGSRRLSRGQSPHHRSRQP